MSRKKNNEFPSPDVEGPFCKMSRIVQMEQFNMITTALGKDSPFHGRSNIKGLAYIKEMTLAELQENSRSLMNAAIGV